MPIAHSRTPSPDPSPDPSPEELLHRAARMLQEGNPEMALEIVDVAQRSVEGGRPSPALLRQILRLQIAAHHRLGHPFHELTALEGYAATASGSYSALEQAKIGLEIALGYEKFGEFSRAAEEFKRAEVAFQAEQHPLVDQARWLLVGARLNARCDERFEGGTQAEHALKLIRSCTPIEAADCLEDLANAVHAFLDGEDSQMAMEIGRFGEAICEELPSHDPRRVAYLSNWARVVGEHEDPLRGVEVLERTLSDKPFSLATVETYRQLAVFLRRVADPAAIADFSETLLEDVEAASTQQQTALRIASSLIIAELFERIGLPRRAIQILEETDGMVRQMSIPGKNEISLALGNCFVAVGNADHAERSYLRAFNESERPLFVRGLTFSLIRSALQQGRRDAAEGYLQKADITLGFPTLQGTYDYAAEEQKLAVLALQAHDTVDQAEIGRLASEVDKHIQAIQELVGSVGTRPIFEAEMFLLELRERAGQHNELLMLAGSLENRMQSDGFRYHPFLERLYRTAAESARELGRGTISEKFLKLAEAQRGRLKEER